MLQYVAKMGKHEIVELLIENGAEIDTVDTVLIGHDNQFFI